MKWTARLIAFVGLGVLLALAVTHPSPVQWLFVACGAFVAFETVAPSGVSHGR